ncbi:MAG: superoxide dismutase family protein [Burkholderiales bacterium]|nr:superoxide dismutase family protein [Burkholderiales bacterium]
MNPSLRGFVLGILVIALGGCGSSGDLQGLKGIGAYEDRDPGLVARMQSRSSAVTGAVRVFDYRDGVQVQLAVSNLIPGSYRLALHERGNCSSPNLFSAGAAWAPPGSAKPGAELFPGFTAGEEGQVSGYVVYLPGVSTSGPKSIKGRSFVIHYGNLVGEAFPGQPNNRVACGVLVDGKAVL